MASAAAAGSADSSPSSPSPRAGRAGRQPWSHVVRGEPDGSSSSPPPISSSDPSDRKPSPPGGVSHEAAAARGKKAAWKRPSPNGSMETGPAVMGGSASWPALSESAKPAAKSQPSASDGAPLSASPGPASSSSLPKQNAIPHGAPKHLAPEHQKSIKRGGTISNGASPASAAAAPSSPPTSAIMPQANTDEQPPRELSAQEHSTKTNTNYNHDSRGGGSGSQAHDGSGDNWRGYGGNRRWNNGGSSGSHHSNYSNRRDQERGGPGGYDGHRRNAFGRDFQIQHRGARPYFRPPPPMPPPFPGHIPQVRPFGNPIVFSDMQSPIVYFPSQPPPGALPFVHHPGMPHAMYFPAIDVQRSTLLKQIDFYFSDENLCRDVYLRQNMDEQGWVPVSLIAGFNRDLVSHVARDWDSFDGVTLHSGADPSLFIHTHTLLVRQITNSIDFILGTLPLSTEVEVQGDKIRKRRGWMSYLLRPSSYQAANAAGQSPVTLRPDNLAAQLQAVDLEGTASEQNRRRILSRSASGSVNNQLHAAATAAADCNGESIRQMDQE